jgi:SAM-dependent methyltransferase
MNTVTTSLDGGARTRTPVARSVWARFADANKAYCKRRLQPRLYPVSHMTALDCWYRRRAAANTGGALLEFGCGRTFRVSRLLSDMFPARFATDIDDVRREEVPDPVVFRRCSADSIPFADEQFDAVVIRSVLEHVDDPDRTFGELARVTRPGGRVLMNLPNKWDYVSVAARLSGRFKSSILKGVVRTRFEDFPVRYRCNTKRALTRVAHRAGFTVEEFNPLPSQPSYLAFCAPLYLAGAIYQFAISLAGLDSLQPSFVVVLRRNGDPRRSAGAGR